VLWFTKTIYVLNLAATCAKTLVTVVVGTGPFYSSGNEMSSPSPQEYEGILALRELVKKNPKIKLLDDEISLPKEHHELIHRGKITRDLISSLIYFPKLLIAGVNGTLLHHKGRKCP
jgi:peroxisomal 3,2-trans-enoyl-CoA isomerase